MESSKKAKTDYIMLDKVTNLGNLPYLPLEIIFKYLRARDRRSLSLTNKHILSMFLNLKDWRFADMNSSELKLFSQCIRNIRVLVFECLSSVEGATFRWFLQNHPELVRLTIGETLELGLTSLASLLFMPNLKYLDYKCYGDFHRNNRNFLKTNIKPISLEYLNLTLNTSVKEKTYLSILMMAGKEIKALHIGDSLPSKALEYIGENLTELHTLGLTGTNPIKSVAQILKECKKLRSLEIQFRSSNPILITQHLAIMGEHCSQLESLCILDKYMPELSFIKFIAKCKSVRSLSLPYHLSVESLSELVSLRPELEVLHVDNYRGSTPCLNTHLSILLSGLPNLQDLSLSTGIIEDNLDLPDQSKHGLKSLKLSLCRLGSEGLKKLLEKCPGLINLDLGHSDLNDETWRDIVSSGSIPNIRRSWTSTRS